MEMVSPYSLKEIRKIERKRRERKCWRKRRGRKGGLNPKEK